MTGSAKRVKCPACGQPSRWATDNAFRPFCSERCKLIDLGAWAADRYSISGAPADPMEPAPAPDDLSKH